MISTGIDAAGVRVREVQDGGVHGRHALEDRHLVPLDDLQRPGRVEPGQQGQRAAGRDGRVQAAGQAEDVEQRQAAHRHVVRVVLQQRLRGQLGVADQVGVGELGALGPAGGSRGIEDHGVVAAGLIRDRGHRGDAGQQRGKVGLGHLDHPRAGIRGAFRGLARRGVPGEQHPRAGVAEVVGDLAAFQQRVHRHHDGPGAERAVERDREGGHVGEHDGDPVSGLHPEAGQQRGHPGSGAGQPRVGQHQVVQPHRRAIGVLGRRPREHGTQVRHHALQPGTAPMPPQLHHASIRAPPTGLARRARPDVW
jgi:hypothetical protein